MGVVTDAEYDFYKNQKIFYYGKRVKSAMFSIKGIFMRFVMRGDLLAHGSIYNNRAEDVVAGKNILYYPISDIDLETDLNFGIAIENPMHFISGYDNVRYAKYIITLYNLVQYVQQPGYKQSKNYSKLLQFNDITHYNCYFVNKYTPSSNTSDFNQIKIPGNVTNVPMVGNIKMENLAEDLFVLGRPLTDVIAYFLLKYVLEYNNKKKECTQNMFLDNTGFNKNNIYKPELGVSVTAANKMLATAEKIVSNYDVNRYILYYTGGGYTPIGTICDYNHFMLNNQIRLVDIEYNNKLITFSNGTNFVVTYNETVSDLAKLNAVVRSIDNTITRIRNDPEYEKNLEIVADEFYVYRMQNYMCINSPNGDQFNLSTIKSGTLIYIPRFLSTSFSTSYNYNSFVMANTFLYRIKVKKSSKKWIILNKYSEYPSESEILLNMDCYFVVKGLDNVPIKLSNDVRDIKVLDVVLCDTLDEAMNLSTNLSSEPLAHIINAHDSQIGSVFKASKSFGEKDVRRGVNECRNDSDLCKKRKMFVNTNTFLYDNTKKISDEDCVTLVMQIIKYFGLLQTIEESPNGTDILNRGYTIFMQQRSRADDTESGDIEVGVGEQSEKANEDGDRIPIKPARKPTRQGPKKTVITDPDTFYWRKYYKYKQKYLNLTRP